MRGTLPTKPENEVLAWVRGKAAQRAIAKKFEDAMQG